MACQCGFRLSFYQGQALEFCFLDEINLCAALDARCCRQLILDRRIGSYEVPENWFIWAAGSRKEDKASVFDMPTPLSNRFMHLFVDADLPASFKQWGLMNEINEQILSVAEL